MSIILPVIFVSILYYAIGHFINKENAKYLLSGYNTVNKEERKKFDIENYLVFFKAFLNVCTLIISIPSISLINV